MTGSRKKPKRLKDRVQGTRWIFAKLRMVGEAKRGRLWKREQEEIGPMTQLDIRKGGKPCIRRRGQKPFGASITGGDPKKVPF